MDEQLLFTNGLEFRAWLINNYNSSNGVWVIFSKSDRLKSLRPDEALEEALCFGWIDGQMKSVDETRYLKKFTPRRKGSKWSEKNKGLADKLIKEGKMIEGGLDAIDKAKKDGTWDIPKAEPIGDKEIEVFSKLISNIEPAFSNFQKMSRSVRATYTVHYLSAKSEDTRKRRLEQIIGRLNENKKPM